MRQTGRSGPTATGRTVLSAPGAGAVHSRSDRHRSFHRRAGPARTAARARLAPRAAAATLAGRHRRALRCAAVRQLPAPHPVVARPARLRALRLGAARPVLEGGARPRLSVRARLPAAAAGVDGRGGRPGALAGAGRHRGGLRRAGRRRRRRRVEAARVAVVGGGRVDRGRGGTRACAVPGLPLGQDRLRPGGRRLPAAGRAGRHPGARLRGRPVRIRPVRGRAPGRSSGVVPAPYRTSRRSSPR